MTRQFSTGGASFDPAVSISYRVLDAQVLPTKSCMCRRIVVERIYTHYLVVCARGEVFAVGGEPDRMDSTRVVANRGELLRLRVFGVVGI